MGGTTPGKKHLLDGDFSSCGSRRVLVNATVKKSWAEGARNFFFSETAVNLPSHQQGPLDPGRPSILYPFSVHGQISPKRLGSRIRPISSPPRMASPTSWFAGQARHLHHVGLVGDTYIELSIEKLGAACELQEA